jgi:hypothetical protein
MTQVLMLLDKHLADLGHAMSSRFQPVKGRRDSRGSGGFFQMAGSRARDLGLGVH